MKERIITPKDSDERGQRRLNIEQLTTQRRLSEDDFIADKAMTVCSAIFSKREMDILLQQIENVDAMIQVIKIAPALGSAILGTVSLMRNMVIKNNIQRKLCKLLWLESTHYPRKLKKRTRGEIIVDYRLCEIFDDAFMLKEETENVTI